MRVQDDDIIMAKRKRLPSFASFLNDTTFTVKQSCLRVQNFVRSPGRAGEAIRNVSQGILGAFVRTWRLQATTKKKVRRLENKIWSRFYWKKSKRNL